MSEIDELREELKYHNHLYYIENKIIITDAEYDQKMRQLETMEAESDDPIPADSPTQTVGSPLTGELETVEHDTPMLGLKKTSNFDDINNFIR